MLQFTRRFSSIAIPACLAFGAALTACSDSTSPEDTTPKGVTINFKAMVGTANFTCGQAYTGLGTSSSTGTPTEFMQYVSNVRLLKADGSETPIALTQDNKWQLDDVVLLDYTAGGTGTACTGATPDVNTKVVGTVANGSYTGIRFDVGLPFAKNHSNQATAVGPLSSTGMFWSWNSGYISTRIDMSTTGKPGGWFMHVGSTGCAPSTNATTVPTSCTARNVMTVTLNNFNASSNVVVADLKTLVATTNLDVDLGGQPGCMSGTTDPECATLFASYGLGFNGGATPASQNFLPRRIQLMRKTIRAAPFLCKGLRVCGVDRARTILASAVAAALLVSVAGCAGDEMFGPAGRREFGQLSVESAPRISNADFPCGQSDVKRKGGHWTASFLRHAFVRQQHVQLCLLPRTGARVYGRARETAIGSTGELHPRNSMTLANVGYSSVLNWANPNIVHLENQALIPMFGKHPLELGLGGQEQELLRRIRVDTTYQRLFAAGFPGGAQPISVANIVAALAVFETFAGFGKRTVRSLQVSQRTNRNLRVCQAWRGALLQRKGRVFFIVMRRRSSLAPLHTLAKRSASRNSSTMGCTTSTEKERTRRTMSAFSSSHVSTGTWARSRRHRFAMSSVSAPYMHDGSIKTLEEVVEHYMRGGRLITSGPKCR